MIFQKVKSLKGEIQVPGDKSISHRSVMFGALSNGTTQIDHFLQGADCLSTISCFKNMGVEITSQYIDGQTSILVHGNGLHGLTEPTQILNVGNSGTTMRLMSGILAGQTFGCTMTGDASIQRRPMKRILTPLAQMGANLSSIPDNGCAPLKITPVSTPDHLAGLHGIHYHSPIASAQVKSCVLLAGLYADAPTSVTEPYLSRNHTELMLQAFGAQITSKGTTATIVPEPVLQGTHIVVPGDISSAAYFIAAALMIPGSEIVLKNVGINPTRDGILRVCQAMGADLKIENIQNHGAEPSSDLIVRHSELHGTTISGELIPTLIDEIPMIAVLACFAKGTTIIKDAQELKVKESNRLDVVVRNLSLMGADITATEDGMIIHGGRQLHGAVVDSHLDHRIAMAFAIAGLACAGETEVLNAECVKISYPEFFSDLKHLIQH